MDFRFQVILRLSPKKKKKIAPPPPSFAESEFHHIQKTQNSRQQNLLKWSDVPSRYPNLSNAWEFAG